MAFGAPGVVVTDVFVVPGFGDAVNRVTCKLFGDGVATTCSFNLSKAPFNLNMGGNPPSRVLVNGSPASPVATMVDKVCTIDFGRPIDLDEAQIELRFNYAA